MRRLTGCMGAFWLLTSVGHSTSSKPVVALGDGSGELYITLDGISSASIAVESFLYVLGESGELELETSSEVDGTYLDEGPNGVLRVSTEINVTVMEQFIGTEFFAELITAQDGQGQYQAQHWRHYMVSSGEVSILSDAEWESETTPQPDTWVDSSGREYVTIPLLFIAGPPLGSTSADQRIVGAVPHYQGIATPTAADPAVETGDP